MPQNISLALPWHLVSRQLPGYRDLSLSSSPPPSPLALVSLIHQNGQCAYRSASHGSQAPSVWGIRSTQLEHPQFEKYKDRGVELERLEVQEGELRIHSEELQFKREELAIRKLEAEARIAALEVLGGGLSSGCLPVLIVLLQAAALACDPAWGGLEGCRLRVSRPLLWWC